MLSCESDHPNSQKPYAMVNSDRYVALTTIRSLALFTHDNVLYHA